MKHALLLIVFAVAAYGLWHVANPLERRQGMRQITRHGLRLGALVLAVLLMLAGAFYLQSTPIL